MKILLLSGLLLIVSDLQAQIEQRQQDSMPIQVAGELAVGGSLDSDGLGIVRLNLTITNRRFSLALYNQGNESGESELIWSGGSGQLKRSEPLPNKKDLSGATALVLSYGPVQQRGILSIAPSLGIGIGWQTETHYYNGRRDHYSGGMWGFGWSEDIYSTQETDHTFLVIPAGLSAEVRLFSFMAITGHAYFNLVGSPSHGWTLGLAVGSFGVEPR